MRSVLISVLMLAALQSMAAVQDERWSPVNAQPAASQASNRAPGTFFKDCADCPEMVVIPAGRFAMGAAPGEEEHEELSDEFRNRSQPQHEVHVESFSAGKFEVTRGQYRVFAEATGRSSDGCFVWTGTEYEKDPAKDWRNPGYVQDDSHPVACVSWDDAGAYVRWLSQKTGRDYRLLTEAEWEYAARAGTTTTRFWGDAGYMSCGYANGADLTAETQVPGASNWDVANCNDRYAYTAAVGSYRANSFGLYDMLGNVWEWTQDCWTRNYSGAPTDGSAWVAGDCSQRVVRGGSWEDAPLGLRAAYRVGSPTVIRVYIRGFRVARSANGS
jgi:formylglycine-generating enzyme required for sulfatase activity